MTDSQTTAASTRVMATTLTGIGKVFDKLLSVTGGLGIAIMLLLSIFIVALTISRYVFRVNIAGLFDLSVYSLIVFPFLTAAYTMKQGQHIAVDVFTIRLPARSHAVLNIGVYAASLVYVFVLGWQSWRWASTLFKQRALTGGVFQMPMGILVLVIVFGCLLLALQLFRVLARNVTTLTQGQASHATARRELVWLPVSLFFVGAIISMLLFTYVNTAAGVTMLAVVILFSGMPVFLALGLIGVIGIYFLLGTGSFLQLPITVYKGMDSFTLTALPLFILGGLIMEESGIAEDMFRFFELWVGRWMASPLIVTIVLGMVFCAISGSSVATTAVVSGVTLPVLLRKGFNKGLATGLVAGATVGTLIPPSIGYVVFGVLTGESVGELFMATILPAMVLFAFYFLYIIILGLFKKKALFENGQVPAEIAVRHVTWKDRLLSFRTAIWGLLTPLIIIGGIYAGLYTPTESAAVLVIYAIVISVFIKRVPWQRIIKGTLKSALSSSMILCIIFSAYVFALVISQLRVAPAMVAWAQASGLTSLGVILLIFVVLLILGCFLESASLKVITLPIFYPLAMAVGVNSLWLGVFYQFLSEIGLLTPPVGLNLFVIEGVTKMPLSTIIKGTMPFLVMMVLTVVIIYFFPQLVTWLPSTMKLK